MEPSAKPTVDASLDQPFTLEPGQTAVLAAENLTVTFDGVLEDGRCPVDIECIVEGHATTAVQAHQDDRAAMTLSLTVPAFPEGVAYEGFRIHAQQLLPARYFERTIRPEDYRLQLLVDRP
jgi:hypothetical protein